MIDHLLHFYRRGMEPFHSLSALSDMDALRIMADLYVEGAIIWERFKDPAEYLQGRRQVERWLLQEFVAKGGDPQESYPIYMVLGRSKWLQTNSNAVTLATTEEIEVPLSIFRECDVSFTYPDSMVSMLLADQAFPECYLPEYHGRLFTLSEIRGIIETNGLPGERWGTNLPGYLANYIEAQVWNREPLLPYVRQQVSDVRFAAGEKTAVL